MRDVLDLLGLPMFIILAFGCVIALWFVYFAFAVRLKKVFGDRVNETSFFFISHLTFVAVLAIVVYAAVRMLGTMGLGIILVLLTVAGIWSMKSSRWT